MKGMKKNMKHLIFDCKINKKYKRALQDLEYIFYGLQQICYDSKMQKISHPILRPYYECDELDSGVSSIMFLKDGGHITFHSFVKRNCYYMDIITNKDETLVKECVKRVFPYIEEESNVRVMNKSDTNEKFDKNIHFGPHIVCELSTELNMEKIFKLLPKIVVEIGMNPILQPMVMEVDNYIDGIIIIAESHISIHYNKDTKIAYIDIFSCMPFNYDLIDKIFNNIGIIVYKKIYKRATKGEEKWKL